jgi:hypothetical protein
MSTTHTAKVKWLPAGTLNPTQVNPSELLSIASILTTWAAQLAQPTTEAKPQYITTKEALASYGMGEAALLARRFRRVKRGRAWAWLVEDIERYLSENAKESKPRSRKSPKITAVNEDPIDQMIARGALRKVGAR